MLQKRFDVFVDGTAGEYHSRYCFRSENRDNLCLVIIENAGFRLVLPIAMHLVPSQGPDDFISRKNCNELDDSGRQQV